jgi:hypothetical protein
MRLGFAGIFAWRPHAEHLHFLAELAKEAGHEVSFLSCDGDLEKCYAKALNPQRRDFIHCTRCQIGGIRSYQSYSVHSIGKLADYPSAQPVSLNEWGQSSASTLARFESDTDFSSDEFKEMTAQFEGSLHKAYRAAVHWIERERIEGLCVFNGRIDITRAVMEAARHCQIPFVSLERTLFGDGLQLLPGENCLGLSNIDQLVDAWKDKPLSRAQALKAASHVATRFLKLNNKEWRAYNLSATHAEWPVAGAQRKILLLPSSRNEFWGHPDWQSPWQEMTSAFDALINRLNLQASDVVLRCHPNWAERIGPTDGRRAEAYYTSWAQQRGIHCISSANKTSSLSLIEQCDAIVVCGGSAALEAGILGKQVIATLRSFYSKAGFQSHATSAELLNEVFLHALKDSAEQEQLAKHISRQVLRFVYTMVYRIPQFVDQIRCVTTTQYAYYQGADPDRLTQLFRTGILQADDSSYAESSTQEDEILGLIEQRNWQALIDAAPQPENAAPKAVHRRWMFRPVDGLRELFRRGDL